MRPETGPWYTHAFRSDGPEVTGQGVKIGNSRDGGDRLWRSVARYDWTNMAYAKIVDSYFHVTKVSGASFDTPVSVYWSSAESYAGAVSGPVLASGSMSSPYFGDQTWVDSLQWWADQGGFPWPGFAGGETAGLYTYQTLIVDLWVEYNRPPTAPQRVWPGEGADLHRLTLPLQVTGSTDSDGDAVTYRFEASLVPDFSRDLVWSTGWGAGSQDLTLGEWAVGKTVFWRAWASDGYHESAVSATWSFQVVDQPTAVTTTSPASGVGVVVSTTTPQFSMAASDQDGGTLRYNFTISGGNDVVNGRASSGWVEATSWRVPEGVLIEGQQYSWTASAREIDGSVWYPAGTRSGTIKVDRRMGAGR